MLTKEEENRIREDYLEWYLTFDNGRYPNNTEISDCFISKFNELLKVREERLVENIINELESNPNEDGSESPNIQHWIERKQSQLRKLYKTLKSHER